MEDGWWGGEGAQNKPTIPGDEIERDGLTGTNVEGVTRRWVTSI